MSWRICVLLGVVGVLAGALMTWVTALGPGVTPDSTTYVATARSLLAGQGVSAQGQPMVQFPPVYPILLALAGIFAGDVLAGARALQVFLYAVTAMLVAGTVYRLSGKNLAAAAFAAVFFLSSATMLKVYSMAWSEPSFILFSLVAFLCLTRFAQNQRFGILVASAIFLALAAGTRYVGLALLPPMLVLILSMRDQLPLRRLGSAVGIVTLGIAPLALWMVRNVLVAGAASPGSFAVHWPELMHLKQLAATSHLFLTPIDAGPAIKVGQLLLVLVPFGIVLFFVRKRLVKLFVKDQEVTFQLLSLLFFGAFLLVLFLSLSFYVAAITLNSRMLSPLLFFLLLFLVTFAWRVLQDRQTRAWGVLLVTILVICIAVNWVRTLPLMAELHEFGSGYTARSWRQSETLDFVGLVAPETQVYSDGPDVLSFWVHREAHMIPRKSYSATLRSNPEYPAQMAAMCAQLREGEAVLIEFSQINRPYLPPRDEIETTCDIEPKHQLADGVVYGELSGLPAQAFQSTTSTRGTREDDPVRVAGVQK